MNVHDVETRLREGLQRSALDAPFGDMVAERILHRLDRPQFRSRRLRWRGWALPLAIAVAVVVAGTVLALAQIGRHGAGLVASPPTARSGVVAPSPVSAATRSGASTATRLSSGTAVTEPAVTASRPAVPADLTDVQLLDLSFTSARDGWLLASAGCAASVGAGDRCPALLHTTDGGGHWVEASPPPAPVQGAGDCGSSAPCVAHIVFANDRTGYAFGPDVLFLTTNGGRTWTRQSGRGADALAVLDNTVVLVRAVDTACPQRCPLFETSPIGSTRWTAFTVADPPAGATSVMLTGHGDHAQLLLSSVDLARGNGRAQSSALYVSSDGGRHWTAKGEPCPYIGAGYTDESVAMTTSSDGAVVIDCAIRDAAQPNFTGGLTITSTDHGEHFVVPPSGGELGPVSAFAAASASVQLAYAGSNSEPAQLFRSIDSGDSWSAVPDLSGDIAWIGFQTPTTGRAISEDGRTLWITHDAGATWTHRTFP